MLEVLKTEIMVGLLEIPGSCPLHLLHWRNGAISFFEMILTGYWKNPDCPNIGKRCLWNCPEIELKKEEQK